MKVVAAPIQSEIDAGVPQLRAIVDQQGLLVVALHQVHRHMHCEGRRPHSTLGAKEGEDLTAQRVVRRPGCPLLAEPGEGRRKRFGIEDLADEVVAARTHRTQQDVGVLAHGTRDQRGTAAEDLHHIRGRFHRLIDVLVEVDHRHAVLRGLDRLGKRGALG